MNRDVLVCILGEIPLDDLYKCRVVCKEWKSIIDTFSMQKFITVHKKMLTKWSITDREMMTPMTIPIMTSDEVNNTGSGDFKERLCQTRKFISFTPIDNVRSTVFDIIIPYITYPQLSRLSSFDFKLHIRIKDIIFPVTKLVPIKILCNVKHNPENIVYAPSLGDDVPFVFPVTLTAMMSGPLLKLETSTFHAAPTMNCYLGGCYKFPQTKYAVKYNDEYCIVYNGVCGISPIEQGMSMKEWFLQFINISTP